MANHFATNVPGTNPTRWSGNVTGGQGGEMTEQQTREAIREAVESFGNQLSSIANQLHSIAENQKQLSANIAAAEADQKARGIYQEPVQSLAGNYAAAPNQPYQWGAGVTAVNGGLQDTLPD